jgi:hypothetical protein
MPCSAASPTTPDAMVTERNAGASVISGARTDRKITMSRTMMSSAAMFRTPLAVDPPLALVSTWAARSPARWARRPAGRCAAAIFALTAPISVAD